MAIVFHCEHCGKKIEAKDGSGGKWGKCPACKSKIYVPDAEEDEDLRLSPIDAEEEERKKKLMAETFRISQDILQEREVPGGAARAKSSKAAGKIDSADLMNIVIRYLRQMADGNLSQAEALGRSITAAGDRALKILEQIAVSDIPESELADIPPQVLAGLVRELRSKIG